jgi:hypothetical protein
MLLVALVIVRKNFFEPSSLFFSEPFIDQSWLVNDNELFAATITPNGAHFLQTHCFLPALTLLYRNCTHYETSPVEMTTDFGLRFRIPRFFVLLKP